MRSRVVIFNSLLNSVLLIHRKKNNRDYWVIPGGGKKAEESPIQTAIREVTEELQIKFKSSELTHIFDINDGEKQSVFFAVSKVVNTPQISGEELRRSSEENVYIPTWVNLESLVKINLQPVEASNKLMNFLYREEKVNTRKVIISVDGTNNIGKTSFINLVTTKNPCIKLLDLDVSKKLKDSNWWFNESSPVELCDEMLHAISKRNKLIKSCQSPIIILDKGINTIKSRLKATFQVRGYTTENINNYMAYFNKNVEYTNCEVSILFKRKTKEQNNYDEQYSKYNIEAEENLFDENYKYSIEYHNYPTRQTYTDFMDIVSTELKKETSKLTRFISSNFIGIAGLSESGKSSISKYLDISENYWNLKIISFIKNAKLLVDEDYRKIVDIMAINLMISFAISHYFKSTFVIESIFSLKFNNVLKEVLGDNYKLLYIEAKEKKRYLRSEDSIYKLRSKDNKKFKNNVLYLRDAADYIIDNSNSFLNTKDETKIELQKTFKPISYSKIENLFLPEKVKEIMQNFFNYVKQILPSLKMFAYTGSTINESYIDGWSDIDVLLIVDSIDRRQKCLTQVYKKASKSNIKIGITVYDQADVLLDRLDAKTVMNIYNIQRGYFAPIYCNDSLKLPYYNNIDQIIEKQKFMRNYYLFKIRRAIFEAKSVDIRKLVKKCFVVLVIDALFNGDICVTYDEIIKSVKKNDNTIGEYLETFIKKLPKITVKDVYMLSMLIFENRA